MRAGGISYNDHTAYSISNILNDELEIHHWGEPERAPHDQSNGDRVCLSVCVCVCVSIVRSHSVYRVNYRCSDIMHVRTPYLEAGSSDRGRGYAKWYLGVNSHHISSESSCK